MKFKKIFEEENLSTFMKQQEPQQEAPVDKDVEADIEKFRYENEGKCARCGKLPKFCKCPEKDYYSTVNAYRITKGKTTDVKESQSMKNIKNMQTYIEESSEEVLGFLKAKGTNSIQ